MVDSNTYLDAREDEEGGQGRRREEAGPDDVKDQEVQQEHRDEDDGHPKQDLAEAVPAGEDFLVHAGEDGALHARDALRPVARGRVAVDGHRVVLVRHAGDQEQRAPAARMGDDRRRAVASQKVADLSDESDASGIEEGAPAAAAARVTGVGAAGEGVAPPEAAKKKSQYGGANGRLL